MSAKPIREELFDYFSYSDSTASSSAFVQARDKILPNAFESLFHKVNASFSKTYHNYQLIAIDGSDLPISYDSNDTETLRGKTLNSKGSNTGKQESMWKMIDRYKDSKAIFIADRNYATWNNMEHIKRSSQFFLIRAKDTSSNDSLKYLIYLMKNLT